MTLSQTNLPQNGSNNHSNSKKCTALEEENDSLREKLSNEEQKSSSAREELKALKKHSEALEAEVLTSEENSLFMKKKVTLFFYLTSLLVEKIQETFDVQCFARSTTIHRFEKHDLNLNQCYLIRLYCCSVPLGKCR